MFDRQWWLNFYEWLENANMEELQSKQSKLKSIADTVHDERIRDDALIAIRGISETIAERIIAK